MLHLQKKAFEEEKATFLKEQFFKLSPFKDHVSTPEMSRGKRKYLTVCSLKDVARLQLNNSGHEYRLPSTDLEMLPHSIVFCAYILQTLFSTIRHCGIGNYHCLE